MIGGDARGFDEGKGWALGPTATIGAVYSLPAVQVSLRGRYTAWLLGEEDAAWSWGMAIRAPLTSQVALDATIERRDRWDVLATEAAVRLMWYF